MRNNNSFTVAIVGRPNVGKSTLFNRLIGERDAIVDNISGVTRDRNYGECVWNGKTFNVVDTGGFVPNSNDIFEKAIRSQVKIAVEEASAIILMTDVTTGITDLDESVTDMLRRSTKSVFLVVNKVDNGMRETEGAEFYGLGIEETFFVSSMSGSGTGDLLDAVTNLIPKATQSEDEEEENVAPKFAIIGQPNVGKSSLVNALTGQERNIVTDIAGTTRDTIDTHYNLFQKDFWLIDTAGIRRKDSVTENLEFYSVMRAIKAIDDCDVAILLLDAQKGIDNQDLNIFRLAYTKRKGLVILVNKWDLIENKDTNSVKNYTEYIQKKIAPFVDVPIIFISAIEKQRIFKAIEEALEVYENRKRRIPTHKMNELLQEATAYQAPPNYKGRAIKLKYATQLPTPTPQFVFFSNSPNLIKDSYRGYLENRIRKAYKFTGVPITIYFRDK